VLAWLLLAGLPFRREETARAPARQTETIAEAEAPPPSSATLVEVPPGTTDDSFEIATTTTQEPPMAATPPPATTTTATVPPAPPAAAVQPPPVVIAQPRPQTQPPARQPMPAQPSMPSSVPAPVRVVPPPRSAEITADEATSTLRNYVRSTRYYDVAGECIRVENRGYRNVGYDLQVWHSCPGSGGGSRLLGRWRVDARTREIFRQREDGRYLRP
jgi:hypothetical protein